MYRRSLCLAIVLCASLLLTACASNTVRLLYTPSDPSILPSPSAKTITVVLFEDKRTNQNIGIRSNGSAFTANSSAADWASRSMGDALLRVGTQVSYATTLAEAKKANPSYILTGVLHEVWLQQTGPTSINSSIRLALTLSGSKGVLYSETLTSTQDRKDVLTTTGIENLLRDTLRDITTPAARKIIAATN